MKKCLEIQTELSAYIDEELPTAVRLTIEEHVRGCGECRKRLAELKKLSLGVMALPRLKPAPGFLTEVHRKIARDPKSQPMDWRNQLFRPLWLKIPVEAMAVIAVVLLLIRIEHASNERGLSRKTIAALERPASAPAAAESEPASIRKLAPTRLVGSAAPDTSRMKTPAEIMVVRAEDFDGVQNHIRQLATAMNGRIVPPSPDKPSSRMLFVELPPEKVNAFKLQLQTAKLLDTSAQSSAITASNSVGTAGETLEGGTSLVVVQIQILPPAD